MENLFYILIAIALIIATSALFLMGLSLFIDTLNNIKINHKWERKR